MTTYFMFGKYSVEAISHISAERTKKAEEYVKKLGGKINSMYVLLGGFDVLLIVDSPDLETVMKISLGLTNLIGISFSSFPAVPVVDFDKITKVVA